MPAFTRRQYAGAAAATTITAGINTTDTTCTLAATTGWPSTGGVPFYVVIDPGTSAEEKCSATISGSTLTLTRAQDDTTASSHSSGAAIYPVFTANDADEANELVAKLTTKGDLLVTTGSALNRLGVGTNAQVLMADSAATNGVKWATSPETDLVTTKGDILVGTAADTLARQGVGANGSVLMADSAQTNGIAWATQSLSNRNILINGGFSVWQRGTSGAGYVSSGGFVADRWQGIRGAAAAGMTMYQITGTSTEIPNNQFVMRLQRDSGNTSTQEIRLFYSAETLDSMSLVGQSVTISFYVRKGSNYSGGDVTGTVYSGTGTDQNLGITGFTGSTLVAQATRTSATLTTGFTRVSATGTVATSAKQVGLIISYTPTGTAGANDFIDIWGVQLEAGSVATPFEFENYGTTLAKCQRYYEKTYNSAVNPGTVTQNGMVGNDVSASANHSNYIITRFPYKVTKRSAPTMTIYDAGGNSGKATVFNVSAAGTDNVTVTADFAGENSFRAYLLGTTSAGFTIHYTASAEL